MTPSLSPTKTFDIPPDTSVFEKLGATGEPAYKAVAELIDNCVDAKKPGQELIVELTYDTHKGRVKNITLEDNAGGMSQQGLVDALKIGKSDKADQKKIGRFGMGMKTALASLGRAWTVTTATSNDRVAYQMAIDLDLFASAGKWQVQVNEAPKPFRSGTRVEISRCGHITQAHFENALAVNLGELFKHYLESEELKIYIQGEVVVVPEYKLVEGSRIEIDTEVAGRKVRGWVGLRDRGGNSYGFSLIRYNRVVMRNEKIGFNVHQQYNRIVGELHLDEFEVNHHKTAFVQTTEAWGEFVAYLTAAIRPVVQQAHELASKDRRKIHREVQKMVEVNFDKLFDAIMKDEDLRIIACGKKASKTGDETMDMVAKPDRHPRQPRDENDTNQDREHHEPKPRRVSPLDNLQRRLEWVNDGEEASRVRWLFEGNDLVIFINLDHPAHPKAEGQHPWAIQMGIEATASFVATERAKNDMLEEPSLAIYEQVLERVYRHAVKTEVLV